MRVYGDCSEEDMKINIYANRTGDKRYVTLLMYCMSTD